MQTSSGQRPRNGGRTSDRPRGFGGGGVNRGEGGGRGENGGRDEVTYSRFEGTIGRGFRNEGAHSRAGGSGGCGGEKGDRRRLSPSSRQQGAPGEGRGPPRMKTLPIVDTGGENTTSAVNECVVCCREILVYAVGSCDHSVCYVCSTRLRVLCKTQECPVCRATVEEVYFVKENTPFGELKEKTFNLKQKQFSIFFQDDEVQLKYEELLRHKCKECERRALIAARSGERPSALEVFPTFDDLTDHVLKEHRRHFCALCVEHLNLFTFERQAYSKNDLRRHMIEGDLDDKSHKGHPRCDFCKEHFLDKDELYRHLKVEHFTCFICNASSSISRVFQYYAFYDDLRQHFKRSHYFCEQGECATARFVAFASELEHKAHCATAHTDHLSREEQRAARSMNLDFGTLPHDRELIGADGRSGGRRGPREGGRRDDRRRREGSPNGNGVPYPGRTMTDEWGSEVPVMDMSSTTDFPSLEGAPASINRPLVPTPQYGRKMTVLQSVEEFPSLGPPTEAETPLTVPIRRATPNFKNAIGAISNSSSLTSVLASSSANRQPNRAVHSASPTIQKTSTPLGGSGTSRQHGRPAVRVGGDLFPSLPEPVPNNTFGNVLKPLPTKKTNSGRPQAMPQSGKNENGLALAGRLTGVNTGWAAVAAGGVTISQKLNSSDNSGNENNKKNRKKGDSTKSGASSEMNGNANQSTSVQQHLVDLRTILPSFSEIENNNQKSVKTNNRQTEPERKQELTPQKRELKGGENLDGFDLNVCGASWGSTAITNKQSEAEKAPRPPTQPRGLRKDEDFPTLGPAQAKDATTTGIRYMKPKYKGLKPGEAVADMKRLEGAFIQPPFYSKRNTEFMGMLKLLLDGNPEQVFEYRILLGNFRSDVITAEEFVQHCLELFPDPAEFVKIFPDLVCLLPNINKQNQLVPIYDQLRIRFGGPCGSSKKGDKSPEPWVRCSECGQITTPEDIQPHLRAH
ncbi:E3 ubiquitin-protein ligase ZNF598-like [Varroa destructor]|uniref:RING-type E3 ubiquitin transferase n=1 Tax=Varroa destructor TaxID=109461 RepID=A0A7M7KLG9_VARDE|nr:E3 ubiquitin-protein ligase ZNF598-like [Varroa destructor]XP_022668540.1 E3 ubiquitin-protein ligase ZNF598-like [Varroa destructor]